jgi:hypothetical protein
MLNSKIYPGILLSQHMVWLCQVQQLCDYICGLLLSYKVEVEVVEEICFQRGTICIVYLFSSIKMLSSQTT